MGTHVDYKLSDVDSPVFQTCPEEKSAVIMQLGTSCPERAVKAAKLCEADIAGVDVNMVFCMQVAPKIIRPRVAWARRLCQRQTEQSLF